MVNDESVQIVISGQGPSQVRLRWRGAGPDLRVVVHLSPHVSPHLAPLCPLMPAGRVVPAEATEFCAQTPTQTLSLELRCGQPVPAPTRDVHREPAPLATAWAAAQRLRQRSAASASSSTLPRRRTVRAPAAG
jgi:hypothetical protein